MSAEMGEVGQPGRPGEEAIGAAGGRGGEGGAGGRGGIGISPGRSSRPWVGYLALIVASGSFLFSSVLYVKQVGDGKARRDQSCRLFERQHLAEVNDLKASYAYLESLGPADRGTTLTRAVVRGLPERERKARQDVAPAYCDEPNIGLPEPDPKIPEKRSFDYLLERPR